LNNPDAMKCDRADDEGGSPSSSTILEPSTQMSLPLAVGSLPTAGQEPTLQMLDVKSGCNR
jgi:hypothetical protein